LDHSAVAAWFVVSTSAWCVFVLQDSVLTGLGRAAWVPVENTVFSVVKVLLVIPLATLLQRYGLLVAWTVAVLVPTLPVNLFIFRRAIPHNVRSASPTARPPSVGGLARFLAGDYVAGLGWIAATTLLPLLVLDRLGPASTASFSAAWVIGLALFAVSAAMGQSLVVRGAKDESRLRLHSRRAMVHALALLVPAVVVILLAAPLVLRIFGAAYAAEGSTVLRLLALAALPNLLLTIVVSEMRVRRQVVRAAALMTTVAAIVLVLTHALLGPLGITGAGVAWLVGQGVVASFILAARSRHFAGIKLCRARQAQGLQAQVSVTEGKTT
jgi:O-antigen/teichoic acid export membrane protein